MDNGIEKLKPLPTHRAGHQFSPEDRAIRQSVFLRVFQEGGIIGPACVMAGVSRTIIIEWRKNDKEFGSLYDIAEANANDLVRSEIYRRGVHGYDKPVVSVGKLVRNEDGTPLTEKVYSDALLTMLAKSRMPEFREKQQIDLTTQVVALADQAKTELVAELADSIIDEKSTD